jgi:hypothetical protein
MSYGREKGFKLGGSKSRGPGLKLRSDMQPSNVKGVKKAPKAARKKV